MPDHPAHDGQASTNPVVVIEVLSPSTEGDDDGEKRRDFQTLASLQAYVLVHQDSRTVRVYRRNPEGAWAFEAERFTRGQRLWLPTLTSPIAVDAIYDDILDEGGGSLLR